MYRRYYYLRRRKYFLKIAKEFRDSHKDYYKKYNKDYHKKNKKRLIEIGKIWYSKNRDRILKQKREYYYRKREELGIKPYDKWWDNKQDNLLKKHYGELQARELINKFSLLKNRSIKSIHYRAKKLKIYSDLSIKNSKEKNGMWRKVHKEETKEKIRKKAKKRFENQEERLKVSKDMLRLWRDFEYAKNQIKSFQLKPTLPEKQVIQICKLNNFPFNYTGDGRNIKLSFNGFCPDFLSKNSLHIIEVNGEYWHRDKNKELRKKKAYNLLGYKLLVIWSKELENPQKVTEKIVEFI